MIDKKHKNIVYLITHRDTLSVSEFKNIILESLKAGVNIVQLREKNISNNEYAKIGLEIKELTDKYSVPLIINDNPHVAAQIKAHGVHVGQTDIDINNARKIVGNDRIIGVSIENIKQAQTLQQEKINYAAISPIYSTTTKYNASTPLGIKKTKQIRKIINIPLFAIGGITLNNAKEAMSTGINGICVISSIFNSKDPFYATKQLIEIINHEEEE